MKPGIWFRRPFTLGLDNELFPNILERLAGTPARLEEKIHQVSSDKFIRQVAGQDLAGGTVCVLSLPAGLDQSFLGLPACLGAAG